MATLLEALYKEYKSLKEKLDKVSDLIKSYGGTVPEPLDLQPIGGYKSVEKSPLEGDANYPKDGTWKEKIFFAIKKASTPCDTTFITSTIYKEEPDLDKDHIHKMVTQYASAMGQKGEIEVDNSGFRNKYYLKYK